MKNDKNLKQFCDLAQKLRPEDFIGLTYLLGVKLSAVEPKPGLKAAEEIFADCAQAFCAKGRLERRRILGLMKKSIAEAKKDATK